MINQDELDKFTGSSTNFQHWSKKLLYTEGIQFVAEESQAYWLIDAIASYQTNELLSKHPELKEFQLWQLEVNADKTAVLTCSVDSDCNPDLVQNIEFTDFPLQQIKLYVCQTVLMLPSEY